ncbi:MAG: hypothetical protein PHU61_03705 [Candidatus Absconditabacteria bacterium]|nr:hypothetical protein [Candidatus Absconditabacteria bacterium]MDD3868360.1 hypothetical protein [Candidatus Absconditabacteria bacterium]MDD4714441.1 hypothetical protein [Candidatus Absconditabacteria bacterium]
MNFSKIFFLSSLSLFLLSFPVLASNLFVWDLLGTHIEVGLNQRKTQFSLLSDGDIDPLSFQKAMVFWSQYDILVDLDRASTPDERAKALDIYLSNLSSLLTLQSSYLQQEEEEIIYYATRISSCEQDIPTQNLLFNQALATYDYQTADRASKEIASLRACVAENTVYHTSHLVYKKQLVESSSVLQKKFTYLELNKVKIIQYYDLLKPQLLQELYAISQTLSANYAS